MSPMIKIELNVNPKEKGKESVDIRRINFTDDEDHQNLRI